MPDFLPAAVLCRAFYGRVLAPALAGVPHAAGLLGAGSDVLGHDTERSTDHDWGPRATVFVPSDQVAATLTRIEAALPDRFEGWPVRIGRDGRKLEHHVVVTSWRCWLIEQLGMDPTDLKPVDWLLIPQQQLLGVVAGPVFADPGGVLARTRRRLAWYPDDVWWWLMACQWARIGEEEAFVQRTAEVGDDLGSAVIIARLVRDAARLAMLIDRTYAPYAKWFGTALHRLPHPDGLEAHLAQAVREPAAADREAALGRAYQALATRHLGLTTLTTPSVPTASSLSSLPTPASSLPSSPTPASSLPTPASAWLATGLARPDGPAAVAGSGAADADDLEPTLRPFHDRPALVLEAGRFAADCLSRVVDPHLRALPLIGSIDQFSDNTALLTDVGLIQRLRHLYEQGARATPAPASLISTAPTEVVT